ncbi:Peptidyl-prolyl isomerase cwc27 [Sparganum proliferum]
MCTFRRSNSLLTVPCGDVDPEVLIDEEKFMDGDCGYTRSEVHPARVKEVAGRPVGEVDPGAFVALSVHQHGGEHKTEGSRRENAVVFYTVGHCEFLRDSSIVHDACHYVIMELTHHLTESSGTDKSPHDIPHFVTIHPVESIRQIHERKLQVGPHLLTLYLQLVGGEDPVHGATIAAKAALTFRKNTLIQVLLQAVEKNVSEYLTGKVQQADSSVVVTDLAISYPFV